MRPSARNRDPAQAGLVAMTIGIRPSSWWAGLAALCLAIAPAAAAQVETAGATQCRTAGYLTDKDPRGTNVRAAPRGDAPIVGRLPPRARLEPGSDEIVGAEFDIVGSKDGWLLIRNALVGDQSKPAFKGTGWISGKLVSFTLGGNRLLDAPEMDAKTLAKLSGETKGGSGYGPDSYAVLQIHGCESHFVEVTVQLHRSVIPGGKPMRGWVEKACSTQLTTCDPTYAQTPFDLPHAETDVRTTCIAELQELLEGETCKVIDFGEVGRADGRLFLYALYAYATKDNVVIDSRASVFERRTDGQLRLRLAPDGNNGTFDKPMLLRTQAGTLLHIPNSESGTGNFNHERLYIWRNGKWKEADTDSWLKTLEARVPKGLGVWKGVYPNYEKMTARTPLWRKGDSNACPNGGSADITLGWSGDRVVLTALRFNRPKADCSDN